MAGLVIPGRYEQQRVVPWRTQPTLNVVTENLAVTLSTALS